jgi:hypothetical protein
MTRGGRLQTVTGDVAQVDHVATSGSGNPTYRVRLVDGRSFLTKTDGGIGYSATNYRPHSLNRPVSPVVLTLRRGRIIDIKRPDGTEA